MIRHTGYIVGLLFVAACVAAYPLTSGTEAGFVYGRSGWNWGHGQA
jgi:hypothetical protein